METSFNFHRAIVEKLPCQPLLASRANALQAMSVAELQEVREALTLDLWMEPSTLALNEVGCRRGRA